MGRGRKTDKNELPIPGEMKKLVQTLKEILSSDFTDTEIYAVLQECEMNPDEAVQRLLSQDKFHEVKSKRERRKEMKEAQESKVRGSNISGVIVDMEGNFGLTPAQDSHNEVGKAANLREHPSVAPSVTSSSSLSSAIIAMNEQPTCNRQIVGAGVMISSSEEMCEGLQPAFIGGPHPSGYSSLADVVRLGRPRATVSHMVEETSYTINDMGSVLNGGEFSNKSQSEEVQVSEHDVTRKNHCLNFAESDCSFPGQESTYKVEGASHYDDGSTEDMVFHNEDGSRSLNSDIPTTALSLEQLSLGKEDTEVASLSKDTCTVVLPKCVQALDADCSHLSFGTYNSGVNTDIPRNLRFNPVKSNLEEASANLHGKSGFFADALYGELSGSVSDTVRSTTTAKNHEFLVSSQPDLLSQNIHESRGYGSNNPKLAPDSILKNTENYSSPWSAVISPLSRELHSTHRDLVSVNPDSRRQGKATKSFGGELLSVNVMRASVTRTPLAVDASEFVAQSVKDSDHVYSLDRRQSNTKRYGDIVSCSGSSIIPTEILDSGAFSLPKAFLPNAAGHLIPQHLSTHPSYSQPALDPEELINLTGYNADPQIYPHASSLQSSYQDSTFFHESVSDMKPNLQKLESIASRSSLPPHVKISAQAKFPKSMLDNSSAIPNQSAIGYNDLPGARYNEANNLAMLQQNDNISSLEYGLGSRTLPAVPDDTYYNRLGQGQSHSTYQQSIRDNNYYNLSGRDEQLSAYRQGVPDNRYRNIQRQNQLLSMYQQRIPDDRYNRQVLDRLLPLSQRGLPSNRYHNLQGQSQQLAQSYAALRSRDAYAALHSQQGSSPALLQSLDDVPPAGAQGSSKQLHLNWQNFY